MTTPSYSPSNYSGTLVQRDDNGGFSTTSVTAETVSSTGILTENLTVGSTSASSGAQVQVQGTAPVFGIRAWASANGKQNTSGGNSTNGGDIKIYGSGNVSRITKIGTGVFVVTMNTAMPNANYAFIATADYDLTTPQAGSHVLVQPIVGTGTYAKTSTQFALQVTSPSQSSYYDPKDLFIHVVG